MSRQRINPPSRTTEDRLLDIIEWFIGMHKDQQKPQGFQQPAIRPPEVPITEFSVENEDVEDARWAYESGLITKAQLEQELAKAGFQSAFIEFDGDAI